MKNIEKFFVCPNCKAPLFRASSVKKKMFKTERHCGKCGAKIARAMKKTLAKMED